MDAINPAHGSLLRVNSPHHGIFSNLGVCGLVFVTHWRGVGGHFGGDRGTMMDRQIDTKKVPGHSQNIVLL